MLNEDLQNFVKASLAAGVSTMEIQRNLLMAGWQEADVNAALKECSPPEPETQVPQIKNQPVLLAPIKLRTKLMPTAAYALLTCAVLVLSGSTTYLWYERFDLTQTNSKIVRDFYTQLASSQVAFTDAGDIVFPDEQKFIAQKSEYIADQRDFIEADLRAMRLTLYVGGAASTTMPILTKGKERSWWETPTGNYKVLGKSATAFSSIGEVWMPYSIQFYGNYLIHGWPYHDDGTPVPQGYSGGCIRLSTEDARIVYNFASVGMPILVLENHEERSFGMLNTKITDAALPPISAKSFLIADLSSGDTLLEKNADQKMPIASLTKLMTAVVAHEIIYLGRSIHVTRNMMANVSQIFYPVAGEYYIGLDLLYPLLMQSSNDTANVLAGFVGNDTFVRNMNAKAASLSMVDTQFADPSGISASDVSTAYDLERLLQYIFYKRPFIFDIGRGIAFENVGLIKIGDTVDISGLQNVNEFVGSPDLIGVKNGQTTAALQTMTTVWNIRTINGDAPVAIIVLGSEDRKKDTEILLEWLKSNYEMKNEVSPPQL